jgi:hypothetical protein
MACAITYKNQSVQLNNMQFARLIDFSIQVAERTTQPEDCVFVERMKRLNSEEFWPGRGFDIAADFPATDEQKFWCRVFFDTARSIVDRRVGNHEHSFWQAQAIHQAYGTALLFQQVVREANPDWRAPSLDYLEFQKVVNRKDV